MAIFPRFTIARAGSLLGFIAMAMGSAAAQHGSLRAVVLDSARFPIIGAEISISSLGRIDRSDSAGRIFIVNLPVGKHEVAVRHLGYYAERFFVDIREKEETSVEVELSSRPTALSAVDVIAQGGHPFFQGFEQRRARGIGTFVTRDQIDARNTTTTSDLFRSMPMVTIVRAGSGMGVRFPQSMSGPRRPTYCTPMVWVDGQRVPGMEIDDVIATDIHAIELYRGASTTPPQFATGGSAPCGVIVVWTRRKGR